MFEEFSVSTVLLSVCWCFSLDRKAINWRLVASGIVLQSGRPNSVLLCSVWYSTPETGKPDSRLLVVDRHGVGGRIADDDGMTFPSGDGGVE